MFVSTRITRQPIAMALLPSKQGMIFFKSPNEMHFSTRQFSLSTRQCLCSLGPASEFHTRDNPLKHESVAIEKHFQGYTGHINLDF